MLVFGGRRERSEGVVVGVVVDRVSDGGGRDGGEVGVPLWWKEDGLVLMRWSLLSGENLGH